jgi:hypothetical protein
MPLATYGRYQKAKLTKIISTNNIVNNTLNIGLSMVNI